MNKGQHGRAVCKFCKRIRPVNADGTFRKHSLPTLPDRLNGGMTCENSGMPATGPVYRKERE